MARLMTQTLTLCGLLGLSILQGCVGEVDLQVLRADMETLKHEYRQHDEAINRQLGALESRLAKPIQELDQTAVTLAGLQEEAQRLRLRLQDLQREGDGTKFTEDMEATFAYLETRLDNISQHPTVANKSVSKPSQPKPVSIQKAARPRPSTTPSVTKREPATKVKPVANIKKKKLATATPPPAKTVTTKKKVIAKNATKEISPEQPKSSQPKPKKSAQPKPQSNLPSTQISNSSTPTSPPLTQTAASDTTASAKPKSPPSTTPQIASSYDSDVRLYEKALRTYQAGNYEGALVLLRHFLNQHAKSALAGNVQYWIGESLYAQRHYKAAIGAFNDVVQHYPDDNKVPAAMLNQGLAFAKLRDVKRARYFLQQVKEKYANSFEADQATETLKELSR